MCISNSSKTVYFKYSFAMPAVACNFPSVIYFFCKYECVFFSFNTFLEVAERFYVKLRQEKPISRLEYKAKSQIVTVYLIKKRKGNVAYFSIPQSISRVILSNKRVLFVGWFFQFA